MAYKKSTSRNNNKLTVVNPVVSTVTTGTGQEFYLDLAELLTEANRKLFSSEYCYHIDNLRFQYPLDSTIDYLRVTVVTAGDTWSVHNAWTKGKALHTEMQQLVLADNPSIIGKWSEFRPFMDANHPAATNLLPNYPDFSALSAGEWDYTTFVLPQHDVDTVTGEPLPAVECTSHLVGDDVLALDGSLSSAGLVLAYQESRRTVQPTDLIPGQALGFFNILTDSGSQEPELAAVIELENNDPPYNQLEYPGGRSNASTGFYVGESIITHEQPNGVISDFKAACGLMRFQVQAFKDGLPVQAPAIRILTTLMLGNYKGIHAVKMGQ